MAVRQAHPFLRIRGAPTTDISTGFPLAAKALETADSAQTTHNVNYFRHLRNERFQLVHPSLPNNDCGTLVATRSNGILAKPSVCDTTFG